MRSRQESPDSELSGFSLFELMFVIAIMILVAAFIAPAFTSLKSTGDVTSTAYTIKGVLEQARTYTMANMLFACFFYGKRGFYRFAQSTFPRYP